MTTRDFLKKLAALINEYGETATDGAGDLVVVQQRLLDEIRQMKGEGAKSPTRLMAASEAAIYIGTTRLNIYQMVSRKMVPFVKIGRSTRFDRKDLDLWIDANKKESNGAGHR